MDAAHGCTGLEPSAAHVAGLPIDRAICSWLLMPLGQAHPLSHGGPSKERQWGETIRHAEQRARETRFAADVAACDAWNYRMEGYGGPHSPPRRSVTR